MAKLLCTACLYGPRSF